LPLDVGAVVQNVATLVQVSDAMGGKPVTEKHVTVGGEVASPAVFNVPVGTPARLLIEAAGGPADLSGYSVIIGGPIMGRVMDDIDEPVTKTVGGLIVLPRRHALIQKKTGSPQSDLKLARSVCCQCNFCTQLCPRYALGLKVEPHKVMRAMALNAPAAGNMDGVLSCCECGVCSMYACNFSLSPSRMMQRAKQELLAGGAKPEKKPAEPHGNIDYIKVPVKRLMARLDLLRYDRDLPVGEGFQEVRSVRIPLKMHIGAPAAPVVGTGSFVHKGQLIAAAGGRVSANVHASIQGKVTVRGDCIEIEG